MKHIFIAFVIISSVSSFDEGSQCTNFDGTLGVCVVDRNCKWAIEKLKMKEIKVNQLVRCSLRGSTSIICCKDSTITATPATKSTSNIVNDFVFSDGYQNVGPTQGGLSPGQPTPLTLLPSKRKSEAMCDLIKTMRVPDLTFHIVNGEGADVGEFPHMVAIGFPGDEFEQNALDFACGGSLIAANFVLTAGHCVNNKNRQPRIVRLGRVSLVESEYDESPAQDINIKKVHLFPGYSSRRKYNDIALLELENRAQFHKTVKPACLYYNSTSFSKTQVLQISGWGRVNASTSEKSAWLQKAAIYEVPLEECRLIYSEINLSQLPENLKISQLCATNIKDGKVLDACQGDSGGPLQFKILVNQETVYYIVGLTSFGASCGSEIPGVYTRVSEYLDWIEGIVWPNKVEL